MLERHHEALWSKTDSIRFLGVRFPIRMGVVRLPDGGLWLWSPVAIDDEARAAIAALGEVRHVVAPNRYHHVHAGAAKALGASAQLYGAPGLAEKRKDLSFESTLGDEPPAAWGGVFEQVLLESAPGFSEVVFFHRPSRTLFVADLLLHVAEAERWFDRLYFSVEGCFGRLAVPRLMHVIVRDRTRLGTAPLRRGEAS